MKNERTSPSVATIAARVLQGKKVSWKNVMKLAGSALTQARDKRKSKRKAK